MAEIVERFAKWCTYIGHSILLFVVNVGAAATDATQHASASAIPAGEGGVITAFSVASLALTTLISVALPLWREWRRDRRESALARQQIATARAERLAAEAALAKVEQ